MPTTPFTKIKVPVGSDPYALTADLLILAKTANVIIPVNSQAERDGLAAQAIGGVLPLGCTVCRFDRGYILEKWDGTQWRNVSHQEFTFSAPIIPNNSVWGPGTLTPDTGSATTDPGLASATNGSDRITIAKAGTYAIWFGGAFGAGVSGNSWFQIKSGDDSAVHASGPASEFWGHVSMPAFRVTADNTELRFRLKQVSGGSTSTAGRVRITRIG